MSLPKFEVQGSLFESLEWAAADLFDDKDKYKVFARKIWPLLASCREELAECYEPGNGRPGIEPVVLLGVLIFRFFGTCTGSASGRAELDLSGLSCLTRWPASPRSNCSTSPRASSSGISRLVKPRSSGTSRIIAEAEDKLSAGAPSVLER
jgi:hypothetical protein